MCRFIFCLLAIVPLALLSGCDVLSPIKTQSLSTYTISDWGTKHNLQVRRAKTNNTILVTTPVAAPGYETSKMVYVSVPFKLKAFANHEWVAPPATLLAPLIVNRLERTGYFHAVVTPPYSGVNTFQLNTRLLMLQQEFLRPESNVHLIVQATLLDMRTMHVVASHVFDLSVPANENNPYAGVLATNRAAMTLSKQLADFVLRAVK